MKFEIEIPDEILEPMRKVCDGFKIPMDRALAVVAVDWIARMDEEMQSFGKPVTPGHQCFDKQFNEDTPLGYEIESSYALSRANWLTEFMANNDFYQKRADEIE